MGAKIKKNFLCPFLLIRKDQRIKADIAGLTPCPSGIPLRGGEPAISYAYGQTHTKKSDPDRYQGRCVYRLCVTK